MYIQNLISPDLDSADSVDMTVPADLLDSTVLVSEVWITPVASDSPNIAPKVAVTLLGRNDFPHICVILQGLKNDKITSRLLLPSAVVSHGSLRTFHHQLGKKTLLFQESQAFWETWPVYRYKKNEKQGNINVEKW